MSMDALQNAIRMQSKALAGTKSAARFGTVSSYNPSKHMVKVMLQPENIESAWMPYMEAFAGNGWGIFAAPSIGNMAVVLFIGNEADCPVAIGMFFNNVEISLAVPSGELWMVHKSNSSVKLTTDGKVTVTDKAGSTVVLNGDGTGTATFAQGLTITANTTINGNLQVNGNVQASQNISDLNGSKGTMQTMRTTYNGHTHPVSNVQSGSSSVTTATPNQQE